MEKISLSEWMLNFALKAARIDKLIFQELETKALAVTRGKRCFDEQDGVWRLAK
jgi:hypothetical protein